MINGEELCEHYTKKYEVSKKRKSSKSRKLAQNYSPNDFEGIAFENREERKGMIGLERGGKRIRLTMEGKKIWLRKEKGSLSVKSYKEESCGEIFSKHSV